MTKMMSNVDKMSINVRYKIHIKALSTLSQKSATVAENGETTATVAEFGDSRTFLRQCGQALRVNVSRRKI